MRISIRQGRLEYWPMGFTFEVQKGEDDPASRLGYPLCFSEEPVDILVEQMRED